MGTERFDIVRQSWPWHQLAGLNDRSADAPLVQEQQLPDSVQARQIAEVVGMTGRTARQDHHRPRLLRTMSVVVQDGAIVTAEGPHTAILRRE